MTAAPSLWKIVRLDDAADIVVGQSPPGSTYNEEGEGVPFFQGAGEFGPLCPVAQKWTTHDKPKMARRGAVLLSVRAPVGPTNVASEDCAIGRGLVAVHATETFDQSFLLWVLRHQATELATAGSGSTFNSVRSGQVRDLKIPAPPLAEQRAIVETIERMLSHLDSGVDGLRGIRQLVGSQYRPTLQHHAVMGQFALETPRADALEELCAAWEAQDHPKGLGPDAPPPRRSGGLPDGWTWATVGQLLTLRQYGTSSKTSRTGEIPVLRMGNIKDGALDYSDLKYLPSDHPDVAATTLAPGDVLFNRTNSPEHVGKTAVFRPRPSPVSFASYLIRLRTNAACEPAWLSLTLNSPHGRAEIQPYITQQVGQANVNGTKLASLVLPLPPRQQQVNILERFAKLDTGALRLLRGVSDAMAREDDLRRTILMTAFEGRLSNGCSAPAAQDLREDIA